MVSVCKSTMIVELVSVFILHAAKNATSGFSTTEEDIVCLVCCDR